MSWIDTIRINPAEVERRVVELTGLGVDRHARIAMLLRAIACVDLTTLSADDTADSVRLLCAKAREPLGRELQDALGVDDPGVHVAAVCVFDRFVGVALDALACSGVPVAAVTAGFPLPLGTLRERAAEVAASAAAGAAEIDLVVTRAHVLSGAWRSLYDEVRTLREACGEARLKTILATGELGNLDNVARASAVCMMAGADFIKTSTGREAVNATPQVGVVMAEMIRAYRERSGYSVGLKPAGGIRTARQALEWVTLAREELGDAWTHPPLLRLGASSLLAEIVRELGGLA